MHPVLPRFLQRIVDRLRPSVGGGSFRIHGVPLIPNEPWWPNPDDSPDTIERAALHSYWDDKPRNVC
jgi:hypothetical protein